MRGADYLIKRVAFAILTIFFAATLNFIIFRAAPGDVASALRCRNCPIEFKEALREEFGLDKPMIEQYGIYLKELFQGNMGSSFVSQQPVWDELMTPLLNTLPMLALGTAFSIVFGIAAGVIAAWGRGTWAEWTLRRPERQARSPAGQMRILPIGQARPAGRQYG